MTAILDNSDILQACATTLAGVLIFLTIERKLDLEETFTSMSRLLKRIESESIKIRELEFKNLGAGIGLAQGPDPKIELDKHKEKREELLQELEEVKYTKDAQMRQFRLKNREDVVTFVTLALLASCILFMILVDNQWEFYSYTSRFLFSFGLISLLIRVLYRAKD